MDEDTNTKIKRLQEVDEQIRDLIGPKLSECQLSSRSHNFTATILMSNQTDSTNVDNGALVIEGGLGIGKRLNVGGVTRIYDETVSSDKDNGALVVDGGAGIEKDLNVGGNVNVHNTTNSTSKDTGALVVSGGAGIEKDLNVGGFIYQQTYLLMPPGVIMQYAASSAPNGWLLCDGSNVSRTTYYFLFSIISTAYGNGDGSTTFNLPNFQDRVGVGASETKSLGSTGGSETHTLTVDQMPSHTHDGTTDSSGVHTHTVANTVTIDGQGTPGDIDTTGSEINCTKTITTTSSESASHTHGFTTGATGNGEAFSLLQPYLTINYIIKY
jgi:microcystin-dependent protein